MATDKKTKSKTNKEIGEVKPKPEPAPAPDLSDVLVDPEEERKRILERARIASDQ